MQTVIGLFDTAQQAQKAVEKLKSNGFTSDEIDLMSNASTNVTGATGTNDSTTVLGVTSKDTSDEGFGEKVGKFFKNLFGDDDDEAQRYSTVAGKTGTVVTVHAQDKEDSERAAEILDESGAVDVNERANEYGYSNQGLNRDENEYATSKNLNRDEDGKTLKVIKEDVKIGKREVETGGKRLYSIIVERPVEENLKLREEKVTVERIPVDRVASEADLKNFTAGNIEMTEHAEVAEVSKQARVVEEVKLSKNVTERTETVHETAHDREVNEENLDERNNGNRNISNDL